MRGQLRYEIKAFTAHQVLQYDRADSQSHIGAPIVLKGHVIGINTGLGILTFYGITKLLKGVIISIEYSVRFNFNAHVSISSAQVGWCHFSL